MSMLDEEETPDFLKEEIPFNCMSWGMFQNLARLLDPDGSTSNNWRMLADKLGYNMQDIMVFESQQTAHGRNTIKVLQEYSQQSNSTVNALYKALQEIDRPDALKELKNGLPEIEKNYRERLQKKHRHQDLQENEYNFTTFDMAYSSNGYQGFPHQKAMMPPNNRYSMMSGNQLSSMVPQNKCYQRQKSADTVSGVERNMGSFVHMFEHSSPEFKRQRSLPLTDSMIVRGHDNHSQYIRDHEPMDHAPSIVDDPVPLPLGLMRGMGRYNGQSGYMTGMSTVVHSKDTMYQSTFKQPKQSERGLKLEIPPPMDRQKHADFCSPGPTPPTPSTPLGCLKKLTSDQRYKPDEAYNDLMRLKQEEELLQSKGVSGSHYDVPDVVEGGLRHSQMAAVYNHQSDEVLCPRSKNTEPPNTFPLRIKSNSCSSTSSSLLNSSAQLTKSHSLPSNMKSSEYRKAFKHIKVFVSYAADDKRHIQRVLNLCQCLDKNGFTCCGDIFHRKLEEDERSTWCQKRFEEADFILCIISPKYRQEVDMCEMDNDADDSDSMDENDHDDVHPHRLHTKHIYRLMYREYTQLGPQRCSRFVPVLFQGMASSLIPQWMMTAYKKLVYIWPKQYKDLLWMLTKPENRVPERSAIINNEKSLQIDTENQMLSEADVKTEVE